MRKIFIISFSLIFFSGSSNAAFNDPIWVKSEIGSFKNYEVQVFNNYDTGEGYFEIFKNGKSIYREDGFAFKIGLIHDNKTIAMGMDITGDGIPDLVVSEWTGGAHCCFKFHIFEIGRTFKKIAVLDGGDELGSHFEDINNDKKLEFITRDWTFQYWKTDFAASPAPRVILRYSKGKYSIAEDLMFKPGPERAEFRKKAKEIKSEKSWRKGNPPPVLWGYMLDLIYTGHEDLALKFIKLAWPVDVTGQDEFLKEFREQLATSPYWPQIQEMNKRYSK